MMKSKQQLRARRNGIIGQLAAMSRNGWLHYQPCDYQPLEKELAEIDAKLSRGVSRRTAVRRMAQRNADRIDGYDRDDLGESPDF